METYNENNVKNKKTGYPSIDKPWLKYYSEEAINSPLPECTIYEYMWENNKDNPNDIALNYFDRKISYCMLFEEIEKAAKAFYALGVRHGDVCTVVTLSCVNSVVVFYALNKIGAISNYVSAIASEDEMTEYIREADSGYVVTLDLFADKVLRAGNKEQRIVVFSLSDYMPIAAKTFVKHKFADVNKKLRQDRRVLFWKDFLTAAKEQKDFIQNRGSDTVSIWAHTGGTTGFPKTVLLTDRAYNAVAMQYMKSMEYQRGEVFLNIVVPFVVYGMLTCMHMPLCLGLTVVLIPKFEATEWVRYFEKYAPVHISGIPSYFSPMLSDKKLEKIDMSKVITVGAGGDGLNETLEEEINTFLKRHHSKAKLLKGYGMTEVCASAVTNFNNYTKTGSAGIPLVKNNLCIWNNDKQQECGYGEEGEICLSSPSQMVAYKDNQAATDALIRIDSRGIKWVHTGDLGYVDEDGFLFMVGRMKRFMFVGVEGMAYKVQPKMIEDCVAVVPGVLEVCAVSAYSGSGFVPKVYIVLKGESAVPSEQIRREVNRVCKESLPDYMRPQKIEFLGSMPKTAIGKIDFKALENRT